MQELRQVVLSLGLIITVNLGLIGWHPAPTSAAPIIPNPHELVQVVQEIESLDAMRSGLAFSLEGSTEVPTMQTMKEVCRPLGMRAMQLSQAHGLQVKQVAKKYRNPEHAPGNPHDQMALAKFDQDPELIGFWGRATVDDQTGTRYYRRIDVEASCLACHGLKDRRPQFVKDGYPQDLAYDFNVGDLRGMYAVFIPDEIQSAIQNAVN